MNVPIHDNLSSEIDNIKMEIQIEIFLQSARLNWLNNTSKCREAEE